jgi:hypothetical protein
VPELLVHLGQQEAARALIQFLAQSHPQVVVVLEHMEWRLLTRMEKQAALEVVLP